MLGARRQDVRILFEVISPDSVANGGVLASEDGDRAGVLSSLGLAEAAQLD